MNNTTTEVNTKLIPHLIKTALCPVPAKYNLRDLMFEAETEKDKYTTKINGVPILGKIFYKGIVTRNKKIVDLKLLLNEWVVIVPFRYTSSRLYLVKGLNLLKNPKTKRGKYIVHVIIIDPNMAAIKLPTQEFFNYSSMREGISDLLNLSEQVKEIPWKIHIVPFPIAEVFSDKSVDIEDILERMAINISISLECLTRSINSELE